MDNIFDAYSSQNYTSNLFNSSLTIKPSNFSNCFKNQSIRVNLIYISNKYYSGMINIRVLKHLKFQVILHYILHYSAVKLFYIKVKVNTYFVLNKCSSSISLLIKKHRLKKYFILRYFVTLQNRLDQGFFLQTKTIKQ